MRLGEYSFLLQDYYVKEWAGNFVMHMLVDDLPDWWEHIDSLQLAQRYGVNRGAESSGAFSIRLALWHFAARPSIDLLRLHFAARFSANEARPSAASGDCRLAAWLSIRAG